MAGTAGPSSAVEPGRVSVYMECALDWSENGAIAQIFKLRVRMTGDTDPFGSWHPEGSMMQKNDALYFFLRALRVVARRLDLSKE